MTISFEVVAATAKLLDSSAEVTVLGEAVTISGELAASDVITALELPECPYYAWRKAQAAGEVERIILDWQLASVPLEKRSIYERKERLALGWETASDEDKALAVKEFEGYAELMAEQGLEQITLYLFDTVPVAVRTLADLLATYQTNGRLYRLVLAEAEKWRNKYPMACTLLPVEIDPAAGHGLNKLEQRIAELKAEVQTKIAGVPAIVAGVVSSASTE